MKKKHIGNSLRRSTESTEGTSFSQPFFFFLTVFFTTSFSQRQNLNVFLTTNIFFSFSQRLFYRAFLTTSFSQRLSHFSQRLSHVILTTFSLHSQPSRRSLHNITIYALVFSMCRSIQSTFFSKIRQITILAKKIKSLRTASIYVLSMCRKKN